MKATLKAVKTKRHYDVEDAPDIKERWGSRRQVVRPSQIVVHLEYDEVTSVLVQGVNVRRDGSLGAANSVSFGRYDRKDGTVPAWIDEFLTAEGLVWKHHTDGGQR